MAAARCCHGVLCSFLYTATAPHAMMPTASRPAMENMAIGPQLTPDFTRIGAVGLRPLPPAALTGPRAPGRPAGCLVPGRALLVAVPLVRAAVLVAVVLADDDEEDDVEEDDDPDDEEDRAGAADLPRRGDVAGVAVVRVVLAADAEGQTSPSGS